MPHFHVHVVAVHQDINPETKQPRFRAEVIEVKPRTFMVNLKDNVPMINTMNACVGKNIMMPAKETTMNGALYLSIDAGGDIIPMPDSQPQLRPAAIPPASASTPAPKA